MKFSNAELFLIYGYNQNPQLSYLYFIGAQTSLFHRSKSLIFIYYFLDLLKDTLSFYTNFMDDQNFLLPQKNDIYLEPTTENEPSFLGNQDNISVALKIDIVLTSNIKVLRNFL